MGTYSGNDFKARRGLELLLTLGNLEDVVAILQRPESALSAGSDTCNGAAHTKP